MATVNAAILNRNLPYERMSDALDGQERVKRVAAAFSHCMTWARIVIYDLFGKFQE